VTRRLIESQLDGLRRRLPDRWWTPYAVLAGGLAIGFLASRVPMFRLVGASAKTVQAGLAVASTVAAVDRFIAERDRPPRRKAA
jgi:hypothetical protein